MDRLDGLRVLVVEDEFLVALDISETLARHGAEVIGPAASLAEAMDLASRSTRIDFAVLDVNLRNQRVFPVASVLQDRKVPFVFVTGYQVGVIPTDIRPTRVIGKPIDFQLLIEHLAQVAQV